MEPEDTLSFRSALTLGLDCPADLAEAVPAQWTMLEGTVEERVRTLGERYAQAPWVESLEPSGAESDAGPPGGKARKTAGALGGRRRLRWGGTNPQAVEYDGFLSGYG